MAAPRGAKAEGGSLSGTSLSATNIRERINAAHQVRLDAGLGDDTNAYRLVHDHYDGLPWLRIDRIADYALIKYRHESWADERPATVVVEALRKLGIKGAAFIYDAPSKDSADTSDARDSALNKWLGDIQFRAPTETILVRENGLTYALSATSGYSCGLFFDMRSARLDLAERWAGKKVLNLFAYTCGFGVALGKESDVTNVDVSNTYLDWGKHNYALNGIKALDEVFVRKDAFDYLEIAGKKNNHFDAIILDPPSYSAGKKGRSRRFSLKKDLPELVSLALDALVSGGELFVATNFEQISRRRFEALATDMAAPRGKRIVERWQPGPDFPVPFQEYHLKTGLIR
ncbi:MAG: 23S rRNA (cytosine1962-C5)-methyltransferase [Bradymonadia bacterium]|jgi:23S rRNA (cytosine1962-C5)-methyltransferase